ncbi:hypothetical protein FE326_06845 [Dolosigranulum pigrum]|uniref:Uncharacterized protein n=1 Tax=Dolosigranulum savutiense TaxID=3110288 RepID=A0AB74TYY4_9LACT|nr:hypothetical protein [Dolosigranulum pigrum]QTJ41900.1 hypothetical protein FE326_06845 [Dolosigranulum pigrum]
MVKYVATRKFKGLKEDRIFEVGEEFEMTIKRSDEVLSNIQKEYPEIDEVMKRVDEKEDE